MFEKLEQILEKFNKLTEQLSDLNIINRQDEWKAIAKQRAEIQETAEKYEEYKKASSDIDDLSAQVKNEKDGEMRELLSEEISVLKSKIENLTEELKILLLPKDPNDDRNVIMEIRAGAGGDEAGLFGLELYKMYCKYAENLRYVVEDIEYSDNGIGGIKEIVFSISGKGAYSKLKYESGVHRVQRVPATESQGRIHTSTVTVAVLPEAEDVEVVIDEKDLKIDTYRSGGAGGQHVNKTESAIRITHLPTGIVVQCQDEKSQIKNREKAMKVLKSRLYDHFQSIASKEYADNRKMQVGTGDRSEKIRTYNFPQGRVTDHRINLSLYNIEKFMLGDIGEMVSELAISDRKLKLEN